MDRRERMMIAFLAGGLDESTGRAWDEHVLRCDQCWKAVREDRAGRAAAARLRDSAPPELADRIRFAVELTARGPGRRRSPRWILAASGALLAALSTLVALVWLSPVTPADPPMIAAVVRAAQSMPLAPAASGGVSAAPGDASGMPVAVGAPGGLVAAGATMHIRRYWVDGVEAAVVISDRAFPRPAGAQVLSAGGSADMAWTATRGRVALYCPSSSVLVAAPVAAGDIPALASRLPVP